MNKFKLGQKVKVIAKKCGHRFPIGHVGRITAVHSCNYQVDKEGSNYVMDYEIEAIKEPNVGDKFRVIKAYEKFKVGDIVTFYTFYTFSTFHHFKSANGYQDAMYYNDEGYEDQVEPYLEEEEVRRNISDFYKYNTRAYGNERYLATWDEPSSNKSERESEVRRAMAQFKVRDEIYADGSGCVIAGNYIIFKENTHLCVQDEDDKCTCSESWKLISRANETMGSYRELTKFQKENWSPELQATYQTGLTDSSGNLDDTVQLNQRLFRLNQVALAKQCAEDVVEEEKRLKAEKAKK